MEVKGDWIVNLAADALRLKVTDQSVTLALGDSDYVIVENVPPIWAHVRTFQEAVQVIFVEQALITSRDLLPGLDPLLEMRQLDAENCGLNSVETGIPAQVLMMVFRLHAVNSEARQQRRPFGVIGDDHAGVAVGAQDLRGVEAETTHAPRLPSPFP